MGGSAGGRGLVVSLLLLAWLCPTSSKCPNLCNQKGTCSPYGVCICNAGYQGADCSERMCPQGPAWSDMPTATDKAHALAECSNRGICNRLTGQCACQKGFGGSSCNRMDCPNSCNGNGKCYTMSELASRTLDSYGNSYTYTANWDAKMIRGCVCDPKFQQYDCSSKVCPDGDDPLTTGQVNQVQLLKCIASSGSFVLYFNGYPSTTIQSTASAAVLRAALLTIPLLTNVKVTFSAGATTVCSITVNVVQIEFIQQFGNNPPLKAMSDTVMLAAGGRVLVSADGATIWQDTNYVNYKSVIGTKESSVCAGRGLCSADGTCSCFSTNGDTYASSNGYGAAGTRGDCGFIYSGSTVATCPGQVQCSGHGLCSKTTRACSCQTGWEGGDCSLRSCPKGLAWFDYPTANDVAHVTYKTCSGAGVCDYRFVGAVLSYRFTAVSYLLSQCPL